MQIVCVGDCGIDHYLPSNEIYFGGISANFVRHAHREFPATDVIQLISVTGNDDAAQIVTDGLAATGVECHITRLEGNTPVQYIEVQADGERRFVSYEEGVLRDFQLQPEHKALIAESDLLVAPVYLQITNLFDELMSIETAGRISIDFADFLQHPDFSLLEKYVGDIDIGFFGIASTDKQMIAKLQTIAMEHDKLFVVTLGADGSLVLRDGEPIKCAAIHVSEVVDTTGAGDAYAAGFLGHFCYGGALDACMEKGANAAARVIQHLGSVGSSSPSGSSRLK
jgi:fructoselysine 6-kinase